MLEFQTQTAREAALDKLIVALDCSEEQAYCIAEQLQGKARWLKIGMTLFYAAGPRVVEKLKSMGFKIFLDLKLHDIPHQVRGAARSVAALGVDMLSCHASGGKDMIDAALEGLAEASHPDRQICSLVAITVLTSFNEQALGDIGVCSQIRDQVELLAKLSAAAQGVVCSPHEAHMIRELLGPEALVVTPGVRPDKSSLGDQSRVLTPRAALLEGASHLVVGRPICQAEDMLGAFEEIVQEIEGAFDER